MHVALGWILRLSYGVMRIVAGQKPLAMVQIIPWDVGKSLWSVVHAPMAGSLENNTSYTIVQLLEFYSKLLCRFGGSFEFLVGF